MRKNALVVGLGIAGMSTALSLNRAGWKVTIVERAPRRRTGGYFIGLFKEGKEAAARLSVLQNIHIRSPGDAETWDIRSNGRRVSVPSFADQPGGPDSVLRGDIEAGLWRAVREVSHIRFSTTIETIEEFPEAVHVHLKDLNSGTITLERFSLVVGADGIRSSVRKMVFGPDVLFLKPFSAAICAFQLNKGVEGYKPTDSIIYSFPKKSLWIFSLLDHAPTALFCYRTKNSVNRNVPAGNILTEVYRDMLPNGPLEFTLKSLGHATDYVFENVYQVKMKRWHTNRIVLIGDAAWCPTLFSGMGASSAILGAVELGTLLHSDLNIQVSLRQWQRVMQPYIKKYHRSAWIKSQLFVPSNKLFLIFRSVFFKFIMLSKRWRRPA